MTSDLEQTSEINSTPLFTDKILGLKKSDLHGMTQNVDVKNPILLNS